VILPTYNEAENVQAVIEGIFKQAEKITSHDLHVLVVDDNSPDNTHGVVRNLMNDYENLDLNIDDKQGLGEAYKRGFKHAHDFLAPDLIVMMDADRQHDPDLIPLFITLANHGFSLVIGSRYAPGGDTPDFSLRRKTISLLGNWMIRFLGGIPHIRDCTSGFRCIKVDYLKKCNLKFLSTRGYSFQSSLLFELLRKGVQVIEVPIIFSDRIYGKSKLTLQDQLEFLLNIGKIRFQQSKEFVKFCMVGISGVFVNLGIYIVLTRLFNIDFKIAAPIAIEISILTNFTFNYVWTFKRRNSDSHWFTKLTKYHIVAGIAGIANYINFLALIYLLSMFDIIANLVGIAVGTLINYSLNSLWTWRETSGKKEIAKNTGMIKVKS
jgi:dolichol-phosphate mannosyltransferase